MTIENKTEITSIRFSKKEKSAILRRAMARGLRLPAHVRDLAVTDGPRYKGLGNSWAVPCARWIGERLEGLTLGNPPPQTPEMEKP